MSFSKNYTVVLDATLSPTNYICMQSVGEDCVHDTVGNAITGWIIF